MSATSWLDALKETLKESGKQEARPPSLSSHKISRDPAPAKHAKRAKGCSGGVVVDIGTARGEDERKLLAAGWTPKERMGLTIWANPETGFYCSQEVALLRLEMREAAVMGSGEGVTNNESGSHEPASFASLMRQRYGL